MAIYMKYADVKGSTTAAKHEKWITLESFQLGGGRSISTPVGSAENREASSLSVSEIVVTKQQDNASRALLQKSYTQTKGEEVEIHLVTTSAGVDNTIFACVLTNTLISGFSTSSGGDRPMESLSLNFTKIEATFDTQAQGGSKSTDSYTTTYDLATGIKS